MRGKAWYTLPNDFVVTYYPERLNEPRARLIMPSLPFSFDGVADRSGVVHVTRNVPVGPLRIKISNFELRTKNGCNNRTHDLRVLVNDDEIYRGEMHDCADLIINSEQSWRGTLRLYFTADRFTPGEQVVGHGAVEFHAAIF